MTVIGLGGHPKHIVSTAPTGSGQTRAPSLKNSVGKK